MLMLGNLYEWIEETIIRDIVRQTTKSNFPSFLYKIGKASGHFFQKDFYYKVADQVNDNY